MSNLLGERRRGRWNEGEVSKVNPLYSGEKSPWPSNVPCVYHPDRQPYKNHDQINPQSFPVDDFSVAAGLSSAAHAQQSTTALTGEWVNSEPPGRVEFCV